LWQGFHLLLCLISQLSEASNKMTSQVRFLSYSLVGKLLHQGKSTPARLQYHSVLSINISRQSCTNLRRWSSSSPNSGGSNAPQQTFLQKFLSPKPMPPRNTPAWYREMVLLCTVFAITGSSTMFLVRPAMSNVLGLEGSLKDGPWSYRICSLVIMTPLYATLLVCVGTVFGRHAYFRHFSVKMFSRFGIPPSLMDKNFEKNAKNFKKW
jgi:hypothetical protein